MTKKFPEVGELVLCKVKTVNPNSVFVTLENGLEGMIHISEISSRWVRDIRRVVKKDQTLVVKVLRVDEERGHISLSLKRVTPKQKKDFLQGFKMEERAKNFLKLVGKELKMSESDVQKIIARPLNDEFGSVYAGFEAALKEPEVLMKLLPKYFKTIEKVAKKNIKIKEFYMKLKLQLRSVAPDGVKKIKTALRETKLDVKYVSAPTYVLTLKTRDPKKGEKILREDASKIIKKLESLGGEGSFEE